MLAPKSTCFRFLQYAKAPFPMRLSDAGAVNDLSPECANALSPRVSNPSLGLTDCSAYMPLNAHGQTFVTVRGNVDVFAQFP